jgi:uncharacterized oligopeptide transporter (OPT) family protein
MMIPMRQVFVIDNKDLKFPEGVACAAVLRAGDAEESDGGSGLSLIVGGMAIGGIFQGFSVAGGLIRSSAEPAAVWSGRVFFVGAEISPALFAVGYILTLPIALEIFAGGVIG